MLQAVELTIRLHPADDVVIARMIATGILRTRENVRAAVTIPAAASCGARHRAGQAGVALQPDHRFRHARYQSGRACPRAQPRDGQTLQRDYAFSSLEEGNAVRRSGSDLPGYRARRRTRRDFQLHRHPDQRELLGYRRAWWPSTSRTGSRNTRTSTAWWRSRTRRAAWLPEGEGMDILRRTMAGYARYPNFYATQVIGLGCEANQINNSAPSAQTLKRHDRMHVRIPSRRRAAR